MPTGSVSPEESNLKSWFDAGVTCVGMGSKLISLTIIKNEDYTGLKESVQNTLELIKNLRS
jgi:2-dehydro-3-deoxyphosphogluconate aldolase/(4S)-4-hydroxy-2-oxoglutarate aldolase